MTTNYNSQNPWIMAIRPKTMLASIGPVLLGLTLAIQEQHHIDQLVGLLTLICAVLLQFSTNIANDYLDFKKGIDTVDRLGPTRVTSSGLISESEMKNALILLLVSSFLIGCYLMYVGGPYIVTIGLLSLYFSYGYTGGPFPLSYHGLGELSALIFFGILAVTGTFYLQTHYISFNSFLMGISVGLISSAILAINNLRDIKTDTETGKRTLAVRIGEFPQRILIIFCVIAPVLINFYFGFKLHYFFYLTILLFLIFTKTWSTVLTKPISAELNNCLANTAKYLFLYSLLTSAIFYFQ